MACTVHMHGAGASLLIKLLHYSQSLGSCIFKRVTEKNELWRKKWGIKKASDGSQFPTSSLR